MLEEAKNTAVGSLDSPGMVTLGAQFGWLAFETQTYPPLTKVKHLKAEEYDARQAAGLLSLHKGHVERQ